MKVAVEVVEAADLMPKDGHGSADAYVEVELDGQRGRTKTKPKDLSPAWNETLLFPLADPALLPDLSIDVSLFHEGSARRNFLGRVRISGASVAPSPAAAALLRFPLEKRGLFSHIRGDIALRLYALPDSAAAADADAAAPVPPSADPKPANDKQPKSPLDPPEAVHKEEREREKKSKAKEPRVFYSVGGAPTTAHPANAAAGEHNVSRSAVPRPLGTTVLHMRPPAGAVPFAPYAPRPEFGALVETRPPVPSRLAPRLFFPGFIGAGAGAADKIASTYDLVEPMRYLYVSVVKARDLPAMDLTGSLDPYVEVKLGNFKGTTKHLEKNQNPFFHQVFAFSQAHLQAHLLEVTVKDKDVVKDDFVGRVAFDLADVPLRVPPDSPLAPQWYRLEDRRGEKLAHGELMLSVWIGTQADESFPEAWHSDAHSVTPDGLANTRSKVYFAPRLFYLRVRAIGAQDLVPADKSRPLSAHLKLELGRQLWLTRLGAPPGSPNPVWDEEVMFVAAEPFDEPLVITVLDRVAPGRDEPLGRCILPVISAAVPRIEHKPVEPRWFSLARPTSDSGAEEKNESKFSSKVHLRLSLDAGYHVLDESTHYSSDLQPAAKHLRKPIIGRLELGILCARNLVPMKTNGRLTDAYCVAKYGPKWVRTRTLIGTLNPQWNEQYTWDVHDPCTVVTIAMFDNCHAAGNGSDARDQRIGKVRIRLSTLETNRVYTHFYPLLVLQTPGLKKTGELHLAVRFTCTAWVNMVALYGRPLLPKMHYVQPIPVRQLDSLRHQAMQIVAARLERAEPPLRREVVEYMLDVDSHMWSLRRSKANFYRIMSLFSGATTAGRWFDSIRNWRNPITTILVHVLFLILVCYPELILPTVFLYLFMIGILNYRFRPRQPPHMDTKLSHAELTQPDELDEEFDNFPSTRPIDVVRMRYDRMRMAAGRVQAVAGDLATQLERSHALLSWRDPRATTIFIALALVVAVVLYVTPFQVIAVIAGLYLLRHPRFRSRMPSAAYNFYRRLPAKSDMLL